MSSTTVRRPTPYNPGLWNKFRAGLRYGGGIGQWAWLFHRFTGVGILLFLVIHIIDTFFVVAYPALYDHTVGIYGGMISGMPWEGVNGYYWPLRWGFRLGELGLIACVLFHSLNGVRVALIDLWPRATRHQAFMFRVVMIVFLVLMFLVTIWVLLPLFSTPQHWKMPGAESEGGVVATVSAAR